MPLRGHLIDLGSQAETFAAVSLGALLATVSGVVANHYEARVRRVEREHASALLFGEVLSSLRTILAAALQSLEVGERFGPVSRRMLIAARREVDIYERNRESLLDLRDAPLRVAVHSLMLRIAMPLDGVIAALEQPQFDHPEALEAGIGFMVETLGQFPALIARLSRLAGQSFDSYDSVFLPGRPGQPPRVNPHPPGESA
jgi:hypothetical protein